jgi:uncharacterized membrane protein YgdD (TMEM256/DUF423 family)
MSGMGWIRIGAISAGISVGAGSLAAHGLESLVKSGDLEPRLLEVFRTAAEYQMYHSLGLLAVGLLAIWRGGAGNRALGLAGWSFLVGVLLFSGSLYAMTFTGARWLGMITPLGGVSFLVGWAALAAGAGRGKEPAVGGVAG